LTKENQLSVLQGGSGSSLASSSLVLPGCEQEVGVLLVRTLEELGFLPEIGSQETVGVGQSREGRLDEVTHGLGRASGLGENVVDTSKLQHLLGDTSSYQTGTLGGGHQTDRDGARSTSDLDRNGMGGTDLLPQ